MYKKKYARKHVFWKQFKEKKLLLEMSPLFLISPIKQTLVDNFFLSFKKHKSQALWAQRKFLLCNTREDCL